MKSKIIGGVLALGIGFLGGWFPEHGKRTKAEEDTVEVRKQLEETGQSLAVYKFRNRAALLHSQADRNDYATAGQEATKFFTDLRAFTNGVPAGELHDGLEKVLGKRDSIIAGLATADPSVKTVLQQLFVDMQRF